MHRFNPVDAAMLFLEKRHTPFHVAMVHIYDPSTCPNGTPSFEDITEGIRSCLPIAPSFRRKIVRAPFDLDAPVWIEDEDFELEFHMRQLALPKPGNHEQLRTQVSRLVSRPLDLSRAPWEMTVIEGLDNVEGLPPGCFAIVLKIHHSAIDGKTGVAMISAMHQLSPEDNLPAIKDNWEPEEVPTTGWLLSRAWANSIKNPLKIVKIILSKSSDLVRTAFDDMRNSEDDEKMEVPDSIFNAPVSPHRVVDDVICPLADLKKLRDVVEGATINDICMAVVAEAMRNYLKAKQALPEESLVTTMTISTRTPEQVTEGGNQIAITRIPLHTNIADPIKRLIAITADTSQKKATKDGIVMTTLLGVVYNLPGALVGVAARAASLSIANSNSAAFSNTMVTNVPGAQQPIYFLGAKCVHCFGTLPLMDGGGLAHSVGSYNGNLIFGFTACREILPDPDFYNECMSKAIKTMVKATKIPVAKPKLKRVQKKKKATSAQC